MSDLTPEEKRQLLDQKAKAKEKTKNAEQWDPGAGEYIQGDVIVKTNLDNQYGVTPLLYVENFDGDVYSVLARHKALEQRMEDVEEGDTVRITFEGKVEDESAPGGFYFSYDVTVV